MSDESEKGRPTMFSVKQDPQVDETLEIWSQIPHKGIKRTRQAVGTVIEVEEGLDGYAVVEYVKAG
ncbi:MAG: hypothetical protein IPK93_10335 [Solirubrobacterales bacterium]|nr:hypothetical protein [Solirubrobacterales bacterium]